MAISIVNGKQVTLPNSASVSDVVRATGKSFNPGTRAVFRTTPRGNERIKPGEVIDVKPGDKFQVGPDRVKGYGESYFGNKEAWRKAVITDQVVDLSEHFFKGGEVQLDENCDWAMFSNFKLPKAWANANPGHSEVRMLLIFPDQYPDLPTNGFYLPDFLTPPEADRHFFSRGYSGAFGGDQEQMEALAGSGWKWYCTHIKQGSWQPARIRRISDWRGGDNLWDIVTLCKEVLTNPAED